MDFLEPTYFYHIFNRGNNKQPIFHEDDNYRYFLKLTQKHILHIADIYCYCLLKNHFHFLVRIKEKSENQSQAFSNLFNAYSKAFNKKYNRTGNLFQRPFKRKRITEEKYLRQVILYIHLNPENHGIIENIENYPNSSYATILSSKPTQLKREEVIEIFDNIENFKFVHRQRPDLSDLDQT
ncbi:hypothetical protein EI546_13570 [Aequorivita sp. H23M31]|uniref:Transposase IS200-like domain-containing protein n=1 Tax=Aequorivita ciconiae TaxID=2494375 RepID=A0A410G5V9_9FLAO|nr:transposase [Aequorivita sp. H23M31]QAA82684.1 hypothetical protein EI546_13570 [Aequorivita sp. H23M31]